MGLLNRVGTQSTRLQHHRALIIGGSGGIGRAVSYALASQGASIICHGGHNQDKLDRVVSYIQDHGGKARGLLVPLERATDIIPHLGSLGGVDILVVALGPIAYHSLADTDHDTRQRLVDLNLVLPGLLLSRYLPAMVDAGWGRIVLFGGPHGDTLRGFRTIAAYGAAKTGLASLCKSAAQQTQGENVAVNLIAPGYVDTEYLSVNQRNELTRKSPRGALIPPERVARLVNMLILADEADMNGAVITLDQGLA
ncbi:MAG TPA: SDR family oxidoreductase [Alkalispirochaeta sp.]|nr:SDR family oxidoreductase [Alkalispirochaeta sp.]